MSGRVVLVPVTVRLTGGQRAKLERLAKAASSPEAKANPSSIVRALIDAAKEPRR